MLKTYTRYSQPQIPEDYLDHIQVAPDGTYWFAGLGKLFQFDPKTETWKYDENYSKELVHVNSFTFGQDGSIWVASGLQSPVIYHLNNQDVWETYDNRDGLPTIMKFNEDEAIAIAVDTDNNVWIATREAATRCVFPKN